MREGMRRWGIRGAWTLLIACSAMLLGLRLGRPLYYTDGQQQRFAGDLVHAGMLDWSTPQPELELPGPVSGRVAMLPDGRLIYGRVGGDGGTDLVVFDPTRPGIAPEPAFGLNTAHHELAPAVSADGRLWFSSDRPGGAGGYDLWVAAIGPGGFGVPEPVPSCNSSRDETDPAPSPTTSELVFVRLQADADGRGVLMLADLASDRDPAPLLPFEGLRRPAQLANDRDPVFARDGSGLWFLRQQPGERVRLLRLARQGGEWDAPRTVDDRWGTLGLRSPLPMPGFELRVLAPATGAQQPDLLYRASGRELQPWWPGQQWLELLLLAGLLVAVVLLTLLHLGRRWHALDLVTQCLLLSLLLHLLLMLWLMRVEIVGSLLPGDDEQAGGLEVTLVSADTSDGGAAAGPRSEDLAAMATFTPHQRSLAAAAPEVQAERAERREAAELGPEGVWTGQAVASERSATAAMQDAAQPVPVRAGIDANAAPAAKALGGVDPAAAAAAQARAAMAAEAVAVQMPGSGIVAAERSEVAGPPAPAAAQALGAVQARDVTVAAATLADAPVVDPAMAARSGSDAAMSTVVRAAPAMSGPASDLGPTSAARSAGDPATAASTIVATPGSSVAAAGRSSPLAASTAAATALPAASARAPGARVALQDAAAPVVRAGGEAPAQARPGTPSPLALAAVGAAAAATVEAARAPSAPAVGAEPALTKPGSDLPTAARSLAVGTVVAPAATAAPRAAVGRVAVAMRDGPAAAANAPLARASAGVAALALQPRPTPVLVPGEAQIARPERVRELGVVAVAPIRAGIPGSLLERAPARAVPVGPVSAPLAASSPYSNRFGPAKAKALEQFGGSADTERAVANGLRYLASIQKRDGTWGDRSTFHDKYGHVYVGKTALCVLAFLGAGHTPASNTQYSDHVRRAIAHLVSLQDEDTGAFGTSSAYGHGITTYALAECYGLTKDPALRRHVEEGLTWILQNQGPRRDRRNQGGWGYFSPGLRPEDDYARLSVTSWMVMALESAKLSGIEVPPEALTAARRYCELAFDRENGWFRYAHKPERLSSAWPTLPASTPAGAFCLMLLGVDKGDERVQAAAEYTAQRRPQEYRRFDDDDFVLRGQGNVYFWYYGSLCCFLAGGEVWQRWNERLSTILPAAQNADGSFTPIDQYASYAGDSRRDRSYTTAMCVLSLEVYYRYFTPLLVGR